MDYEKGYRVFEVKAASDGGYYFRSSDLQTGDVTCRINQWASPEHSFGPFTAFAKLDHAQIFAEEKFSRSLRRLAIVEIDYVPDTEQYVWTRTQRIHLLSLYPNTVLATRIRPLRVIRFVREDI